jgi:hypothetical protein
VHRIRTTLALAAAMVIWLPAAPGVAAQQPTLDLARDPVLHQAVADARRLGLVGDVRQSELGTLQLTVGPAFTTATSTTYNLGRLYLAYAAYQRGYDGRIVLELMQNGERIGEYGKDGLRLMRELPAPPPAPSPAAGPAPRAGRGYAALGAGNGSADFTCERCVFERSPAISGYLILGRRLGERTVLGIEATGWQKSDESTRGRLYTIAAVALGRFDDNLPLFLSGGIGYAGYRRRMPAGTAGADALGYSARLGAELRVARGLSLAPYVGLAGSFGQPAFAFDDGTPYGLSANFSNLQVGAAIVLQ